jgi:hypothetical protein
MVSSPDLVRRIRIGDDGRLLEFELTSIELDRLRAMACDDRMEVICSLYRSNRLTALINTVPNVVQALGDRLAATASEFWATTPRADLQFLTEAAAFCDFVSARFPSDPRLLADVEKSRTRLTELYDIRRHDNPELETGVVDATGTAPGH